MRIIVKDPTKTFDSPVQLIPTWADVIVLNDDGNPIKGVMSLTLHADCDHGNDPITATIEVLVTEIDAEVPCAKS